MRSYSHVEAKSKNGGDVHMSSRNELKEMLPLLAWFSGVCFLYIPSFIGLFTGIWSTDEQAHGPIVLAISLWLIFNKYDEIKSLKSTANSEILGWIVLFVALLFYFLGRTQDVIIFEIGSLVWVLAGLILIIFGSDGLRKAWFPLFFMLFMVPLPGVVVDTLTMPMKLAVSYVVEQGLHSLGYPIARDGVVLHVGQYQLLVADACAGLHTLFTLEALGLLYLNLIKHASLLRNIVLAVLIVPISFSANVIRVAVLTLITFHFGDEAGQGFLHGFAGMVLFISALMLIIISDSVIRKFVVRHEPSGTM